MPDEEHRLFHLDRVTRVPKLRVRRPKDSVIELREFGGWTLEKLRVLELYLSMYRRVAGNGTYIDGFAGQGGVAVRGLDPEQRGSVRLALDAKAFKRLFLFELNRQTMDDLMKNLSYWYPQSRLRRQVRTVFGDFNEEVARLIDDGAIPRDKPCFAFLDPNSTELCWETVELLARFKEPVRPPKICKTELWILFNTHQALGRLVDRKGGPGYDTSGRAATLDRVMGGRDAWWPLYQEGKSIHAYASRYAERLREDLGYGYAHPQIINDPATGQPQYYMVHATDHPAALDFMRWAKEKSMYFDETPSFPDFEQ